MADGRAFTGTPDASGGNPVDITIVTNASSLAVDRQTISIGDPSTIGRVAVKGSSASAAAADFALVVAQSPNSPNTVTQGPAGASAWLISGPVTLVTSSATIGAVQLVTGAAVVGALATGSATIGQVANVTGSATIGSVGLVTGSAVIGALATGSATIGAVSLVTGAAAIGSIATGSATLGSVALVTATATIGQVVLATGAAAIGSLVTGTATIGQVALVTGNATIGQVQIAGPARTNICITFASVTGVTTEALATIQINKAGTLSSGTTYTVTTGKTLRVQTVNGHLVTTGATGQSTKLTVRNAAAVTVASPGYAVLFISAPAAVALVGGQLPLDIPDGLEFASATQVGISHLASTANLTENVSVIGYEY